MRPTLPNERRLQAAIVIVLDGGLVQDVYAMDGQAVIVIDQDTEDANPEDLEFLGELGNCYISGRHAASTVSLPEEAKSHVCRCVQVLGQEDEDEDNTLDEVY